MVHSLGGWIFKEVSMHIVHAQEATEIALKAIIRMNNSTDPDDRLNLQCIYGALFFGVPSQGMNVEAMASMVEALPARYTLNLLDQQLGFRLRNRQHEDFCKAFAYEDSKIVQFFELKKTPTVVQVNNLACISQHANNFEGR